MDVWEDRAYQGHLENFVRDHLAENEWLVAPVLRDGWGLKRFYV